MTGYSYIYIILSVILLLYSISNRLDLLCVAAVCYIVYSIYCIPGIGISGFYRPRLSPSLYGAVYVQLLIIISYIVLSRFVIKTQEASGLGNNDEMDRDNVLRLSFRVYTLIILAFAIMNILSAGVAGFMEGKSTVWERTNVFYIISLYGAWASFAYGIHNNDKMVWIISLLIELTIFFAGSRAFLATIIVIFLCEKGTSLWKNRKGNLRIFLLGAFGIVFLLIYRMVDHNIMVGDISGALTILKNPDTWLTALEFNEPRVIIANYDYAFTSGVRMPLGDVIYRIIDFVPGLTSLFKIDLMYPEYYSTWLMEQVHGGSGVGGSVWGESYSMMGFPGIVVFTLIWLAFIYKCNKHLDYHGNYSYFLVSLGIYFAWYINRLDFNRIAQACKVMLLCFLIWLFVYLIFGGVLILGKTGITLWNRNSG